MVLWCARPIKNDWVTGLDYKRYDLTTCRSVQELEDVRTLLERSTYRSQLEEFAAY